MGNKQKKLVVAESPSKARTIGKILGNDYIVRASFGHILDLPKSKLGFDSNKDFKPEYSVTKDKFKIVRELKSYVGKDTIVYLASDDDREGTIIARHLKETLGVPDRNARRVIFHEITEKAIRHAIDNPVQLDENMADAAMARRILDRAVGYKLSPLLWTKIKYGLSAGRTQSAAVRIIVDKEIDIENFKPDEVWKVKLNILSDPSFKAELSKIDGKKSVVPNETLAKAIKADCGTSNYVLDQSIEKESYRTPPPPFTTSTLQQAASSKLGFGVKQTMTVAQRLYEGSIQVTGHEGGLITYMRTDSVNLSNIATSGAKKVITSMYGKEYSLETPRNYATKSKGAQEAHEAIRPTNMATTPAMVRSHTDDKTYKLYSLIWSRTMATQMAKSKVAGTTYKILGGSKKQYEFIAKGTKILFAGYLKAYGVGDDDTSEGNDGNDKILPSVSEGTVFDKTKLTLEQTFTKPPARYNEASLVKKLETEGIGRPATYASLISTIMARDYVEKTKDKKLAPTAMGRIVNQYLLDNFPDIVNLKFTANIETEFDKIAEGKTKWQTVMHGFYDEFVKTVESKQGGDRVQFGEDKIIGVDETTGKNIYIKTGPRGSYLQLGDKVEDSKEKPRTAPIPKGKSVSDLDVTEAMVYLSLPKVLGQTSDGKNITAKIGMYGGYVSVGDKFYSVKGDDDIYNIELPRALEIIKTMDEARAKALWWTNKEETLQVIEGRYGVYLKDTRTKKKVNHKLKPIKNREELVGKTDNQILKYVKQKGK